MKVIKTPRGKFKLGGRLIPTHPSHAIRLKALMRTPIDLPKSTNRRAKADASLRQMYLNDALGDCVIAGRAHRIGLLTGYATGVPFLYTKDDVIGEYSRIGGYNGKAATDNGCDMTVAANDGVTNGYADGSHDVGWIAVDPTDKMQVMTAMYLFEVGDFGVALPDAWVDPFPGADGFVWDVAGEPDYNNGHCYQFIDYNDQGLIINTWALEGIQTWNATAKYGAASAGGELFFHLNQDQLDKAIERSPDGVAWGDLIAAFNAMGGNVPVPEPTPAPPAPDPQPTPAPVPAPPAPSSGVTLDSAKAWAAAGVKTLKHLSSATREQVNKAVAKSLAAHWPA